MKPLRTLAFRSRTLLPGAATLLCLTHSLAAANLYWDGSSSNTWATAANWSTDPASSSANPAAATTSSDIAHFNITSLNTAQTITLNGPQSASGLIFLSTGTTTLTGGGTNSTLTLGADGIAVNGTAGAVTIGSATGGQLVNIALAADQFWTNQSTSLLKLENALHLGNYLLNVSGIGNTTVAGVVSSTGGVGGAITKTGTGTLTLSATNTYTGTTTVSAGYLVLGSNNALGSGNVVINGGTLDLRTYTQSSGSVNLTAGSIIGTGTLSATSFTLGGSVDVGVYAPIGGSATLVKSGTEMATLRGTNTYTGATTIHGGMLSITADSALGTAPNTATPSHLVLNGGTLATTASFTLNSNRGIELGSSGGTTLVGNNTTLTYGGITTGSGSLTKSGSGTLVLTGANNHTGGTIVAAGTLRATQSAALGNGTLTLSGGTLHLANNSDTNFGRNTTVNAYAALASDRTTSGAGVTHTLGTLSLGAQTLRLTAGANVASGTAGLSFGDTTLTASGTIFSAGPGTALTLASVTGGAGVNPSFTVTGSGNTTLTGAIATGTGSLTKSGTGTLTLSGSNTFSGSTTLSGGTLALNYATNNNSKLSDTASLTLAGGTLTLSGGNHPEVVGSTTINPGATTLTASGSSLNLGTVTRNIGGTLNITSGTVSYTAAASSTNVNGILPWATVNGTAWAAGSGTSGTSATISALTVETLNSGNPNTAATNYVWTNSTALSTGNAKTANAIRLDGAASGVTLTLTNTLTLTSGGILSTGTVANSFTSGTSLTGSATNGLIIHQYNTAGLSIATVITGTNLTKTGPGPLTLSGTNTYTGTNTINQGTLTLGNASGLGNSANALNLTGTTATLALATFSPTVGTVTLANGASITGTGTLTGSSYQLENGTISAPLGGASSTLTKSTTATVTLSGNNTYAGATSISAGTLAISHANALGATSTGTTVTSGAALELLGGITTAAEPLTLNGTGINTTGALRNASGNNTFSGNITLASTSRIQSDATGNTLTLSGTISGAFGLTIGGPGNTTISGAISTGTITKEDAGKLTLSAANTYSGIADIRDGILEVTQMNALNGYVVRLGSTTGGTDGSLVYNITSTTDTLITYQHFHFNTAGSSIVNTGTARIDIHGTLHTMDKAILLNGGTAGIVVSSQILGDVPVRIAGSVFTRGGALASSGSDLAYVGSAPITLDPGARFIIGHDTGGPVLQTLAGLSGGAPTGAVPTPAAVVGFDAGISTLDLMTMEMGPFTYYGTIGGSGGLNPNNLSLMKRAMGTQILAGDTANTFTGLTSASSGVLQLQKTAGIDAIGGHLEIKNDAIGQGTVVLAAGEQIPNTSNVTLSNGGKLMFSGSNLTETVASISSSNGIVEVGAHTLKAPTVTLSRSATTVDAYGTISVGAGGQLDITSGGSGLSLGGTNNPTITLTSDASANGGRLILSNNVEVLNTLTSGTASIVSGGSATNRGTIDLNGSTRTFTVHNGSATTDLLVSASITSTAGGLTKAGAGTMHLTGTNTYAGATTINAGTLQFAKPEALYNNTQASWTAANLTVSSGTTAAFNVGGSGEFTSTHIDTLKALGTASNGFANGSILGLDTTNASGGNFNYASTIANPNSGSNALGLTKLGTGTLTLSGTNTYTGTTTLSAGTLALGSASAIGTSGNVTFTGGTLQFGNSNNADLSARIANSTGPIAIDTNGQAVTFTSALAASNTGGIIKSGTGTLTLSNATNAHSGATAILNGTLAIASANALGSGSITLGATGSSSGVLLYNGPAATLSNDIASAGTDNDTIRNSGSGELTLSGNVSKGSGALLIDGGSFGITLNNAVTGPAVNLVTAGKVTFSTSVPDGTNLSVGEGSKIILPPGQQTLSNLSGNASNASIVGSNTAQATALTIATASGLDTFSGIIGGNTTAENNLGLTKNGAGILMLTGTEANTYSGDTTVTAGTLQLNKSNNKTAIPGKLTISGGTVAILSSGQLSNTSNITIESTGSLTATNSGQTTTFGTLTNNGGTFNTGANTFIGTGSTITWADGTNTINAGGTLSDAHWVITGGTNTVQGGATRGNLEVPSGGLGMEFGGTNSPTLTLNSDATQAGRILLSGNLTVLSTLTSGTAQILSGGSATHPGYIDLDNGTRTISVHNGSAATDLLISAPLTNGGITKTGTGTLTLNAANTHSGTTTISSGTLALGANGSFANSSTIAVASGATLDLSAKSSLTIGSSQTLSGTGTIIAPTNGLTIAGTLAPGNSPGRLTSTGELIFSPSAGFQWEIDTTLSGAGTGYDAVTAPSVSGSNAIFQIVLTGTQDFADPFWDSNRAWTDIFTTDGTSAITNWVAVFGGGFSYSYNSKTTAPSSEGYFTLSGNTLNWTAVPEPSSALAGLLIAAGLLRRHRNPKATCPRGK